MHDSLPARHRKVLGTLETTCGHVIANGGAEFNDDGRGFFVPQTASDAREIAPGNSAVIRTKGGHLIAIRDVETAAATSGLPLHYVFTCASDFPELSFAIPGK